MMPALNSPLPAEPLLDVDHLSLSWPDGLKALDDVCLRIQSGENVALIGANGAGKTSLLLALVGILESKKGALSVAGTLLGKKTAAQIRRQVGLVFQNPDDQLFMPRIYDDIAFGLRNANVAEEEIRARVAAILTSLDIAHLKERSALKLSGGEKRMAAIASVLVMDPSLVLYDEPTAFLDPKARRGLASVLRALPHAKLIATHDLPFAEDVCDRIILLHKGQIRADGIPAEILRDRELMESCGL